MNRRFSPLRLPVFLALAALALGVAQFSQPFFHEADLYYHARAAIELRRNGPLTSVPQASRSLFNRYYSDKEFLYHAILMPFVDTSDPIGSSAGVKAASVALGVFAVAGILAAIRATGFSHPFLLTFAVLVGNAGFFFRMVSGRPHVLALGLLFFHVAGLLRRRPWLVFVTAVLAPLSHSSWVLFPVVGALYAVSGGARRLALLSMLGAAGGLLMHPGFPMNLMSSYVQNSLLVSGGVREGTELLLGNELFPVDFQDLLAGAWPLVLVCLVLTWTSASSGSDDREKFEPKAAARPGDLAFASLLLVGALVLNLRMVRFVEFLAPATALWAAAWAALEAPLGRRRLAVAVLLLAAAAGQSLHIYRKSQNHVIWAQQTPETLRPLVSAMSGIPTGSTVFHCGFETGALIYFLDPRLRFFNFLDPVFFHAFDPKGYEETDEICFAARFPAGLIDRLKRGYQASHILLKGDEADFLDYLRKSREVQELVAPPGPGFWLFKIL